MSTVYGGEKRIDVYGSGPRRFFFRFISQMRPANKLNILPRHRGGAGFAHLPPSRSSTSTIFFFNRNRIAAAAFPATDRSGIMKYIINIYIYSDPRGDPIRKPYNIILY